MTPPRTLEPAAAPTPVRRLRSPARQRVASPPKVPARTPIGAPVARERWDLAMSWDEAFWALLDALGGPAAPSERITVTHTPRRRHTAHVGQRADLAEGLTSDYL